MAMRTLLTQPVAARERIGRYPKHPFRVNTVPFSAQPFMLAPVLPGETMNNLYMEARCVTKPVLNPIIGWKKEFMFFYVRISDLLTDAIKQMFVDPENEDLMATLGVAANNRPLYQAKGGIDFTARCLKAVTEHYFRDEGDAWDSHALANGIPMLQIRDRLFMDSLTDVADMPEGDAIAEATDAGDLERLMNAFEHLRAIGLAGMTYEDFLRQHGIRVPGKDENKPELLAHFSDFQYPSNTIDPSNGTPTSAVSWVFKNGQRDPKLFKEPGFVLGVSICRPKVYFAGLAGSAASFMGRAFDWMPGYLNHIPETSLKNFGGDTGPLGDRTTPTPSHWLDMRDLLLYGDQFHNVRDFDPALTALGAEHMVALPDNDLNFVYPTEADVKSFFKDGANAFVMVDGYASLNVKGVQRDYTVTNFAEV